MKKNLQTTFSPRQYMVSRDFEIFYYNDRNLSKVPMHQHNYYEFYFFLEGDVSMQIGDKEYPIETGDIMLIPPNTLHHPIIHNAEIPYRRFVFWISQEYCNYLLQISPDYVYFMQYVLTKKNYILHNDRIIANAIQTKVLGLIQEMQSEHFGKTAQITLDVNDLILYLNRLLYEANHPHSKKKEISLSQQLAEYIQKNIEDDLSLEKLSQLFHMSKYHIAHVFKDHMGMSIHQYITKKRLILCREAILGEMSITEAYETAGFGDYSSFYRAFVKEYGISPKDFRNMQMNLKGEG